MSLTKDDIGKITKAIKSENELVLIRLEKLESQILNLKLDNHHEHDELKDQMASLRKMESEDLQAIFHDLQKLEKRVLKLEVKPS